MALTQGCPLLVPLTLRLLAFAASLDPPSPSRTASTEHLWHGAGTEAGKDLLLQLYTMLPEESIRLDIDIDKKEQVWTFTSKHLSVFR
jgi:hypothetical protein